MKGEKERVGGKEKDDRGQKREEICWVREGKRGVGERETDETRAEERYTGMRREGMKKEESETGE